MSVFILSDDQIRLLWPRVGYNFRVGVLLLEDMSHVAFVGFGARRTIGDCGVKAINTAI